MPRLYLVRHGQASAGFADHADPGLNQVGQAQALQTAQLLCRLPPISIISSPLARARETALPLLGLWHGNAGPALQLDDRVSEIASEHSDLTRRAEWLASIMTKRWSELSAPLQQWARGVLLCLLERPADTVVFSHFIAISGLLVKPIQVAPPARTTAAAAGRSNSSANELAAPTSQLAGDADNRVVAVAAHSAAARPTPAPHP